MKFKSMITNGLALGLVIATGTAVAATGGTTTQRQDYGFGGTGGGNLEMYGGSHDSDGDERAGDLRFIYGGGDNQGLVRYIHYGPTNSWVVMMELDSSGVLSLNNGAKIKGTLYTEQVIVSASSSWPDYVFDDDYKMMSLEEVESFVSENKHLPGIPTASEVQQEGQNLAEINRLLVEKVEELTLHMIDLNRENKAVKEEISALASKINQLDESK